MEAESINRREAIKRSAALLGFTVSTPLLTALLNGCSSLYDETWKPSSLSVDQLQAAEDLAEVIFPRTETPGAKDAKVERFIDILVDGYFSSEEKEFMLSGLDGLADDNFTGMSFEEQNEFVKKWIHQPEGEIFFRFFKQFASLGFFSSEPGATQVLNYQPIPGYYSGCEALDAVGGRTWR
ncbi:MAG: gluconate 2-dehydrogenase subunit 3 family protein [Balneolaceae bacterium]|nr:MAG: gluconate 2-dehydrogenase subunit 3 family protein [Balneolaceae bacterium]